MSGELVGSLPIPSNGTTGQDVWISETGSFSRSSAIRGNRRVQGNAFSKQAGKLQVRAGSKDGITGSKTGSDIIPAQPKSRCMQELLAIKDTFFSASTYSLMVINFMIAFVPLGLSAGFLGWGCLASFGLNFLAIIALSAVLGSATEAMSRHTGQVLGGLLNATLGNAVEMSVTFFAVKDGLVEVTQMSLIGSLLSNLLLVLGMSFIAASFKHHESTFNASGAGSSVTCLVLASLALTLPTVYTKIPNTTKEDSLLMSRIVSVVMMCTYICFIYFQLSTHSDLFENSMDNEDIVMKATATALRAARSSQEPDVRAAVFSEEPEDGMNVSAGSMELLSARREGGLNVSAGSTELAASRREGGLNVSAGSTELVAGRREGGLNVSEGSATLPRSEMTQFAVREMSLIVSVCTLVASTLSVMVCSKFLVASIHDVSQHYGMPYAFIGLIMLPILGNAAEHTTAVTAAYHDLMDLSLSVAIGSSTQVALFVIPYSVIVGWFYSVPLGLDFHLFSTTVFLLSVFIASGMLSDGSGNWFEGLMLCSTYAIVAVIAWYIPDGSVGEAEITRQLTEAVAPALAGASDAWLSI